MGEQAHVGPSLHGAPRQLNEAVHRDLPTVLQVEKLRPWEHRQLIHSRRRRIICHLNLSFWTPNQWLSLSHWSAKTVFLQWPALRPQRIKRRIISRFDSEVLACRI